MLKIDCPWCGVRTEDEFSCGGESHLERPSRPESVSDEEWTAYLFQRKNPKGIHYERWRHTYGCRQWFNVARHTVTHDILAVYRFDEPRPQLEGEE